MAEARPPTLFRLYLSLLDRHREREEEWVEALPGLAGKVDGILLVVPSWQEAPNALARSLVERAGSLCRGGKNSYGGPLTLYWGRRLWITWHNLANGYVQHKWDVYDPAYYAAVLSRIAAEAAAIGAEGTIVSGEPHGDKVHTEWFKTLGFGWWNRRKVAKAIAAAQQVAPMATLAYPAGSMAADHYSWPLRYLGKEFLHSKTYITTSPDQAYLNPPGGMPKQMDWWGSWVTATGDGKTGPLTIEQYRSIDWAEIRAAYPELKGSWIFTAVEDRLEVMQALGA